MNILQIRNKCYIKNQELTYVFQICKIIFLLVNIFIIILQFFQFHRQNFCYFCLYLFKDKFIFVMYEEVANLTFDAQFLYSYIYSESSSSHSDWLCLKN